GLLPAAPGRTGGQRSRDHPVRRLEHRAHGAGPEELAQQPEELGLPAQRACVAHEGLRRGRLGRRLPPAAPGRHRRELHVVEQPRPGMGEERRLAARLPDRDAGDRGEGEAFGDLHRAALLRSCAAHHRLRGARVKILVTGAAGFIGTALVRALAARHRQARVVAFDLVPPDVPEGAVPIVGDIGGPGVAASLVDRDTAQIFHLASLVSGGAEADFERGMRVNLDATRELLEAARRHGRAPTFVFASSIAVYGGDLPPVIGDDTPALPQLSYGAHKLACEILINDYSRRGFVDGRSLRLPTVMVRPGAANTAVSGWASAIVRESLAGRDCDCPVGPGTSMACVSLARTVEAFLHVADLPAAELGAQ